VRCDHSTQYRSEGVALESERNGQTNVFEDYSGAIIFCFQGFIGKYY
jgi:hypothetical protein